MTTTVPNSGAVNRGKIMSDTQLNLSIRFTSKPAIAKMKNGEVVKVLRQAPKPAHIYPADTWVLIEMPDGSQRIIRKAALMLASRAAV